MIPLDLSGKVALVTGVGDNQSFAWFISKALQAAGAKLVFACHPRMVGIVENFLTNSNADVQAGINIVLKAIEAPLRQIAENSGVEGSIVVNKILENKSETFGFDAQTEEYVDMLEKGIVDPAKVVRAALQDAASIAGLLVTTEAMVGETPKEQSAMPAMPPGGGGMGGMGGMGF